MKTRSTLAALLFSISLPLFAQNTTGTWTANIPLPDDAGFELAPVPPLGKDNALNCSRNVIPIKFAASNEDENLPLVSDFSDTETTNDVSTITFDPSDATMTVSDLTNLTAVYEVVEGNCGGGALRWQIDTASGNVFVYYGAAPTFTDCNGAESQSGVNLLSLDDARVDSSQVYPGTQVNTWDAFVAANPDLVVESVSLVADAGWFQSGQIQSFSVSSLTVNDNTFTGDATECDLPDATIRLTDEDGEEVAVDSPQGSDTAFREDDCQYIYNLKNPGPGTYTVEILIEGNAVASTTFTVSCKR